MINAPLNQFLRNVESIDTIDSIHTYFEVQVPAIDISEILRAEFVLLVSAFDYYIHDIVREGMLSIFDGKNKTNKDFDQFAISLKAVNILLSASDDQIRRQLLDNEIRKVNSKHSYQAPSNVERALSIISFKSVWKKISIDMKMNEDDIVKELGLIVHRRNKIAHEADMNPVTNEKSPIDKQTIRDVRVFLINIVRAIDKKITTANKRYKKLPGQ
ncbi:MAG TPA: HEPN domain-containing protein [Bacteroidales bacterium]|nr:HEPN domain-containing protein [Bacteroidales bacterium]HQI69477.1 HEPN domain-containing protein [Bacteroidales bacterium]